MGRILVLTEPHLCTRSTNSLAMRFSTHRHCSVLWMHPFFRQVLRPSTILMGQSEIMVCSYLPGFSGASVTFSWTSLGITKIKPNQPVNVRLLSTQKNPNSSRSSWSANPPKHGKWFQCLFTTAWDSFFFLWLTFVSRDVTKSTLAWCGAGWRTQDDELEPNVIFMGGKPKHFPYRACISHLWH